MANLNNEFISRFEKLEKEYDELDELLCSVEIVSDNKLFRYYKKRFNEIEKITKMYKNYKNIISQIKDNEELFNIETDSKFLEDLKKDTANLLEKKEQEFEKLKIEFKTFKELKTQDVQLEFVLKQGNKEKFQEFQNIFFLYAKNYSIELNIIKQTETSLCLVMCGENVFEDLIIFLGNSKIIEKGKDTVIGVSVLKVEKTEMEINEEDIIIETLKSSGAGGQHINKTESAVRLIHKPTGLVAYCGDERSQRQNKEKAFEVLKNKISAEMLKKQQKNVEFQRKNNKNALFSSTPTTIFDYDKNIFYALKTNQNYKLKDILLGELKIVSRDVIDYE